jgi:hypothetical protein
MSVDTIDINVNDYLPVEIDIDVASTVTQIDIEVDPLDLSSQIADVLDVVAALQASSNYIIVDETTPLPAEAKLSFKGPAVQVTDNPGALSTDVTVDAAPQIATHAAATDPHGDRAFATAADTAHAAAGDPHPQYETSAEAAAKVTAHTGAADPHGDRAFTTSAVSTHAGATDPHADRAYANSTFLTLASRGAGSGVAPLDSGSLVPVSYLPSGASGVLILDGSGKVPTAALPPLAINKIDVVADQAARLALTSERGDMAIQTDNGRTYVLSTDSPSTNADWKEVLAAGQITSVNGTTSGAVTISLASLGGAPVGRLISAGAGLTGGGDLSIDRTLAIATGGVTDAMLAGSITPSKITGTAVVTADARLSDARTPTAHKASHATGGTDALSPADIGAATTGHTHSTTTTYTAQLGGIATLAAKVYSARIPIPVAYTLTRITVACVAGSNTINFQVKRTPSGGSIANFGSAVPLTAGSAYVDSALSLSGSAGDVLQIEATGTMGTAPTNVTVTLTWTA